MTAVTATPLWDVKSKAQGTQAKRACTVLGLEIGEVRPELEVVRSGYRSPCISLGREQRRGLAQPQRLTW